MEPSKGAAEEETQWDDDPEVAVRHSLSPAPALEMRKGEAETFPTVDGDKRGRQLLVEGTHGEKCDHIGDCSQQNGDTGSS